MSETIEQELDQIVKAQKPPRLCHFTSNERPTHWMCGLAKNPGATIHDANGDFLQYLATGICVCGVKKCPDCLRLLAYKRLS